MVIPWKTRDTKTIAKAAVSNRFRYSKLDGMPTTSAIGMEPFNPPQKTTCDHFLGTAVPPILCNTPMRGYTTIILANSTVKIPIRRETHKCPKSPKVITCSSIPMIRKTNELIIKSITSQKVSIVARVFSDIIIVVTIMTIMMPSRPPMHVTGREFFVRS